MAKAKMIEISEDDLSVAMAAVSLVYGARDLFFSGEGAEAAVAEMLDFMTRWGTKAGVLDELVLQAAKINAVLAIQRQSLAIQKEEA